jgi:hypothetical protein
VSAPPRVLSLPGGEPLLHYGPATGPQLLVLQPLFEEMNRCRALVAALCRGLATRGVGCWMPDLPGCGESVRGLEAVRWSDWTDAVGATCSWIAAESGAPPAGSVALRGGALLDTGAARRWRLSPVSGASLLTDLRRSGLLASGAYPLGAALAEPLNRAQPEGAARTVRLSGDERPCDARIDGPAIWRRPEPESAAALADTLVEDITTWLRS